MQWWMWIPIGWFICIMAIWAFAFVAHGEPKKPDENEVGVNRQGV